jgi:hypothetical protein
MQKPGMQEVGFDQAHGMLVSVARSTSRTLAEMVPEIGTCVLFTNVMMMTIKMNDTRLIMK